MIIEIRRIIIVIRVIVGDIIKVEVIEKKITIVIMVIVIRVYRDSSKNNSHHCSTSNNRNYNATV